MSSFETVVQQIENHDAMVTSAIREADEKSARAKAQLNRVRKDGQLMRKRLAELREQAETWKDRAKRIADTEQDKALECLRRYKKLLAQISDLEVSEREHCKLERDLAQDLATVEQRLAMLRQQRNVMRTRQSRAEALQLIQQVDSSTVSEIDDIFCRWESNVIACEARSGTVTEACDDLEVELATADEERELVEMLRELKTGNQ
jgi:phage shock protein A